MNKESVREGYDDLGVEGYYEKHQGDYTNPHQKIIKELLTIALNRNMIKGNVLDLCCGSGEVTTYLQEYDVTGLDPYTAVAYKARTGKEALPYSFKDIVLGKLDGMYFDTIICSFAMHLCEESMLPQLLWKLGEISNRLIILTPHKRPDCDGIARWCLVEEVIVKRVRMRVYIR